jgi:hypothetical protein
MAVFIQQRTVKMAKFSTASFSFTIAISLMLMICFFPATVLAQNVYKSKKVDVYYTSKEQLAEFASKVIPGGGQSFLDKLFVGGGDTSPKALGRHLDLLFMRVQNILNMPIPKQRVRIRLYPRQEEVYKVFVSEYGGPNATQKRLGVDSDLPAFYVKKTNSIHISTESISRGMLAHEMAHCITSNYFVIKIPTNVAELMSQYVDKVISKR